MRQTLPPTSLASWLALSSNTSTTTTPIHIPGDCSPLNSKQGNFCILFCTHVYHQGALLFQSPQGYYHMAPVGQLLPLDPYTTWPIWDQGTYTLTAYILSQGTYGSPFHQDKGHPKTKRGAIHLLRGTNTCCIVAMAPPDPHINTVGSINFNMGWQILLYNKEYPSHFESNLSQSTSSTLSTPLTKD